MKKSFFYILFFTSSLVNTCLGQTNQGSVLLGGSLNFGSYHVSQNNNNNPSDFGNAGLTISPTIGYFVANRVAVGSSLSFNYSVNENYTKVTSRSIGYSVAPFIRYYKFLGEKVALFGSGAVNYSRYKTNVLDATNNLNPNYQRIEYGASVTPGLTYFLSPKFGLEASLGRIGFGKNIQKSFATEDSHSENLDTNFGGYIGLAYSSIGIYFYLNR